MAPHGPRSAAHTPAHDLYTLLINVLPFFIDLVRTLNPPKVAESDFCANVCLVLLNLNDVLFSRNLTEIGQRRSVDEDEIQRTLESVLKQLDRCIRYNKIFLFSPRRESDYPRLRLLQMYHAPGTPNQEFLKSFNKVTRLYSQKPKKREEFLQCLQSAFQFFYDLCRSSCSSCPAKLELYPSQHVNQFACLLFDSLKKNWGCQCKLHLSGEVHLSLTSHRSFETIPTGDLNSAMAHADFRILFPTHQERLERQTPINTDGGIFEWQDTQITVKREGYEHQQHEEVNCDLCKRIRDIQRPNRLMMSVYGETLWQLRSVSEDDFVGQIQHSMFIRMATLLNSDTRGMGFSFSSIEEKDRLILSFTLATFVLQFYREVSGGPWLERNLTNEKIYFLRPFPASAPCVTKPYLSATCSLSQASQPPPPLGQAHPYPVILSLGILLLEIACASAIELTEKVDRCSVALNHFNAWKKRCRTGGSNYILEGLEKAITACLQPAKFAAQYLNTSYVQEHRVRDYLLREIVFPLGDALSNGYKIDLGTLPIEEVPPSQTEISMSFDHYDEEGYGKKRSAEKWYGHLENVYDLVEKLERKVAKRRHVGPAPTRVKVAILDTGLQLPNYLQDIYVDERRISVTQSEDFVGASNFMTGSDGHGSRVAQTLLKIAPIADVHIARVLEISEDLQRAEAITLACQRIAKAVHRATNDWKVDIIVMSFGFDQSISIIQDAISQALTAEKPPLFFAATGNHGAHKNTTWPASTDEVFGISSTDGDGCQSTFNPDDGGSDTIFYALGEAIPVTVAEGVENRVTGTSYATPVAAGLVANLLGCVRMAIELAPTDKYDKLLLGLQQRSGMKAVLKHLMNRKSNDGHESLLPWEFLRYDEDWRDDLFLDGILEIVRQYSISV